MKEKKFIMKYWEECIREALDEAGIRATDEQIDIIVEWVEGAHENYGMAHGHDAIPNPLRFEVNELKQKLKREQEKVICVECSGSGRIISYGPYHSADSECYRCRGEGRHLP